ncbi:MAG: hypothetical protein M1828_001644 [Chrysothrix sp. TS-e1954]|nr:MAG: hypothetical protein M1828_001644 [Chrysothrix sp. TS-e1954]
MVKLTSIFIFIYGALLVAPGYYYSPLESTWKAPATLALSAVPLLLMTVTTPPFVTFVHLTLPIWARASSARLHRYAQAIPSTAELDVTTMRWIWPRVTHLRISELHIDANAIGAMTIKREVPEALKQRPWWTWRPLKSFYVAGKSAGKIPERGVWDETLQCIVRGWDKPGLRGKMFVR